MCRFRQTIGKWRGGETAFICFFFGQIGGTRTSRSTSSRAQLSLALIINSGEPYV